MPTQALTDTLIRNIKPPVSGRIELNDARCRGLTLRVSAGGEKSWAFRYRDRAGASQRLTMGRYPDLSLADARARADDERRKVTSGGSPATEKRQERENASTLCFDHLADRYMVEHARRFKRSADEDERSLKLHIRPKWGRRRYADIRRRDVVELIEEVYASGRIALAVRLKATISKIFAFAISKDLLEANPAAGIGRIADLKPRERVLSDEEIRFAWKAFGRSPISAKVGWALRLVLTTGQRPGEIAGLHRSELINLDDPANATWRLPAARSKNGREHIIPLSPLAVSIIKDALGVSAESDISGHVFRSPRSEQPITAHALAVAMARVAKRLETGAKQADEAAEIAGVSTWRAGPPTPHDLRRTAATRMRALGIGSDDVKRVLNHAPNSVLGRHYDHYDAIPEKRRALETWAIELERIISIGAPR